MGTDNIESAQQLKESLPTRVDGLSHLFTSSHIAKIGVANVQRLAEKFAPDVAEQIREFSETESHKVSQCLKSMSKEPSSQFIVALGWVYQMSSETGSEWLRQFDLVSNRDESCGSFATRAYFDHPEEFQSAARKYRETENCSERAYSVFEPSRPIQQLQVKQLGANLEAEVKALLADYFKGRDYGPNYTVTYIEKGNRVGFSIEKSLKRSGKAVHDWDEQPTTRLDRSIQADVVFYDPNTHTVWVASSSQKDRVFLADVMGLVLFGAQGVFSRPANLDLSFATSIELSRILSSVPLHPFRSLKLNFRRIRKAGEKDVLNEQAPHRAACLGTKAERYAGFHDGGTVLETVLRVELATEKFMFEDIVIKQNSISAGTQLTDAQVVDIIFALQVMRGYANA